MIIGWDKIRESTGLSQRMVKRLAKTEAFPLYYIGGRPVTSSSLVDEWLKHRIKEEGAKYMLQ